MIRLHQVSKSYGQKTVLKDLSLSVEAGEILLIMGPSGCGKTTLFRLLMGLTLPDCGTVDVAGAISPVFQEDRLCGHLSATDNLRLVCPALSRKESAALLTELGLADEGAPVSSLSGGMKRRVALARALAYGGSILLLDEPFSGLDEETKKQAAEATLRHRRGRTLLVISHDPTDAALLKADRVWTFPHQAPTNESKQED